MNEKIRAAVKKAGGVTRVSNRIGVSGATVYMWINNGFVPNYDKAKQLSELSGVPFEELRKVEEAVQ